MKFRKNITIFSIIAFLAILLIIWFWIIGSTQNDMRSEHPLDIAENSIPMTDMPFCAVMVPGLKFKIDTGADISSLSDEDAEKLKQMGYEVKTSYKPITGRDGYGRYIFSPKRYTVTLPMGGYKVSKDSLGNCRYTYSGHPANKILNVDFAPTANQVSSLGLDFLRKYKLEFDFNEKAIKFHDTIPADYQHVSDLLCNVSIKDKFWSAKRLYIILSINQRPQIYQMDTGLQRTAIKMPEEEIKRAKHILRDDSIFTMRHSYSAKVDDKAWVEFGNRCGTKAVYYYDNQEDSYQMNPLNMFEQDLVIDIEGQAIYFRPYQK